MYCTVQINVLHGSDQCTARCKSMYCTVQSNLVHSADQCTALCRSMYYTCTVQINVLHGTDQCTARYRSMYCTVQINEVRSESLDRLRTSLTYFIYSKVSISIHYGIYKMDRRDYNKH